eukprot:scaffold3964_cov336-Prasinococcus_capsulatus_cf.AAC.10
MLQTVPCTYLALLIGHLHGAQEGAILVYSLNSDLNSALQAQLPGKCNRRAAHWLVFAGRSHTAKCKCYLAVLLGNLQLESVAGQDVFHNCSCARITLEEGQVLLCLLCVGLRDIVDVLHRWVLARVHALALLGSPCLCVEQAIVVRAPVVVCAVTNNPG